MELFLSVLFSIIGLCGIALIFFGLQRLLKLSRLKMILITLLLIIGFIIYYIGYYQIDQPIQAAAYALLSSIQMLVLNNNLDGITNPIIKDNPYLLMTISIISVFIFGILAQTIIITLFKDLKVKFLYATSRAQTYFLVYGYDETIDFLLKDMNTYPSHKKSYTEEAWCKDYDKRTYKLYASEKIIKGIIKQVTQKGLMVQYKEDDLIYIPRTEVIDYDYDELLSPLNDRQFMLSFIITGCDEEKMIGSNLSARLKHRKVFVLDEHSKKEMITEKGLNFLSIDKPLPKCQRHKHLYYFFMLDDDMKNIDHLKKIQIFDEQSSIYIRIKQNDLKENISHMIKHAHLHIVNEYQVMMNEVFDRHPIQNHIDVDYPNVTIKEPFKVFIGGLSGVGYELMKNFIIHGQFVDYLPYVYLNDHDTKRLEGSLFAQLPEINHAAHMEFVKDEPGSKSYYESIISSMMYQYVCFCYDDEDLNIELSINLVKRLQYVGFKHMPIILCYSKNEQKRLRLEHHPASTYITFFGSTQKNFNLLDILQDKVDAYAKIFFYSYEAYKQKEDENYKKESYKDIDVWTAESNRQVLMHIPIKLKMLNLTVEEALKQFESEEAFKKYIENIHPDALDRLSEMEHLRWNALHYVHGWTNMRIEEAIHRKDEIAKGHLKQAKFNKDFILKKHVCLVSYQALLDLEKTFHANYQKYDTNNVTNIIDILKS